MTENAAEPIICPVTAWYHKRKIAMILLLLGLSAFFFYDWKVGYPKKQSDYESYWPEYQRLVLKEKKTAEWFKLAKEKGWPGSQSSRAAGSTRIPTIFCSRHSSWERWVWK
jgi:hypothetical protein